MYIPYRPKRSSQRIVRAADPEETDITDISHYVGKRIEFLKDLPKTVVSDWGWGRVVMNYVTHNTKMVIYTITQEVASYPYNPGFNSTPEIRDSRTVALFYANAGNGIRSLNPVAMRTIESDRLHRRCGTHPALRHLIIDRRVGNTTRHGSWCAMFLRSMDFDVGEKF